MVFQASDTKILVNNIDVWSNGCKDDDGDEDTIHPEKGRQREEGLHKREMRQC